jgi:hypothetical protein
LNNSGHKALRPLAVLRAVSRIVTVVLLMTAVVLIVKLPGSWPSVIAIAIVAASAIGTLAAGLVLGAIRQQLLLRMPDQAHGKVSSEQITPAVEARAESMTLAQAVLFADLITEPRRYFARIAESATLMEGHTLISMKYTIELPARSAGWATMVPLLTKSRGALTDGLKLYNADQKRISSVPFRTQLAHCAAVCRVLVEPAHRAKYVDHIEPILIEHLGANGEVPSIVIHEIVESIRGLYREAKPTARGNTLILVVRQMLDRVAVLVEVEPDAVLADGAKAASPAFRHHRFTLDQDIALINRSWDPRRNIGWRARPWALARNLKALLMVLMDIKHNEVLIPLDNADRARSYHLQCDGLPGVAYLGDQHLDRPADNSIWRIKPLRGQAYSHLYVQEGRAYRGLLFQNSFYEIPPGSTGIATGVAVAAGIGVALLGLSQLHWTPQPISTTGALLLGLPGAVAAFVGVGRTGGFLRGSLIARLSTLVSLVVALIALGNGFIRESSKAFTPTIVADDLVALDDLLVFWLVMWGAQAVNILAVGLLWLYRSFAYWAARTS